MRINACYYTVYSVVSTLVYFNFGVNYGTIIYDKKTGRGVWTFQAFKWFTDHKKMGKHKFNLGCVCEFCASHADTLPKYGKFLSCPEAPEGGKLLPTSFRLLPTSFGLVDPVVLIALISFN